MKGVVCLVLVLICDDFYIVMYIMVFGNKKIFFEDEGFSFFVY